LKTVYRKHAEKAGSRKTQEGNPGRSEIEGIGKKNE
jgi:hypothetical protein